MVISQEVLDEIDANQYKSTSDSGDILGHSDVEENNKQYKAERTKNKKNNIKTKRIV